MYTLHHFTLSYFGMEKKTPQGGGGLWLLFFEKDLNGLQMTAVSKKGMGSKLLHRQEARHLERAALNESFNSGPSSGDCPWQATNTFASQLSTREEKAALFVVFQDKILQKGGK